MKTHRFSAVALGVFVGLGSSAPASVTTWNEAGDAGNLPATAQVVVGVGPLQEIVGTLSPGADADVYRIRLDAPAAFGALTEATANGGDTQLFLFDANGRGIATNDDDPGGGLTSNLVAGNPLFTVLPAGEYLLGISWFNNDPFWSAPPLVEGDFMFPFAQGPGEPQMVIPPTPGGAVNPLVGWIEEGNPPFAGGYTIRLKNASFVVPEPSITTAVSLAAAFALRRRRVG